MTALYAGSFHPPTLGHLDVIQRSAELFERVIVAVMANPLKSYAIPADERVRMLKKITGSLKNVEIVAGEGLTAELARKLGAQTLVRGVRGIGDLETEMQQAHINRALTNVETVFLPARLEHIYVSSTAINDLLRHGGSIEGMVPADIYDDVRAFAAGNSEGV